MLEVIHQGTTRPTILGTLRGSTVRASKPSSLSPTILREPDESQRLAGGSIIPAAKNYSDF